MYYIGLMSGTSADAIDAALVKLHGEQLQIIDYRQYPLDAAIRRHLRDVNLSTSIAVISHLDGLLGEHFGHTVRDLLRANGIPATQIRAIGSHGQTILHLPEAAPPRTWQLGDPNIIAERTGVTTVADFRRADMAVGGQGAPLAPAFHAWRLRDPRVNRVVLNIGGIANITILPAAPERPARGFDTGPGNTLMDAWTQQCQGRDYDEQGCWAATGSVRQNLLQLLLSDPYFAAPPPKSTGRDDFNLHWLAGYREKTNGDDRDEDIQATLLELTALSITDAIATHASATQEVLICGGGIHNTGLRRRLQALLPGMALTSTADYGIDPDAVEAVTFAWLAHQRLENIPANLPAVTGAQKPVVLGAIYAATQTEKEEPQPQVV